MKENVLDVLMFLFENFIYDEDAEDPDREVLESQLVEVGFHRADIEKAFSWLEDLASQQRSAHATLVPGSAIRVYSESEIRRLDTECRGFLMFLTQKGYLTPTHHELVVDRVLALDQEEVDLERLKWIILMVLFNQPGQEAAFEWMEGQVFDNYAGYIQ